MAVVGCEDSLETLVSATQAALHGRIHVSPAVDHWFATSNAGLCVRESAAVGGLTERQAEVLRLSALGYTIKETASSLGLSEKTVESHRYRISKRLGVHDRSELVQIALREGLITS